MRYMILFVDKTFKKVNQQTGQAALASIAAGRPIIIGDTAYGAHYISAIKPMKEWVEDLESSAQREGKKLCKFGTRHEWDERCFCKGVLPLWEPEDLVGLPPAKDPEVLRGPDCSDPKFAQAARQGVAEAMKPMTPEEQQKFDAYQQAKRKFLSSH